MKRWLATNLISISLLTNGFALATSVKTANNPKTTPESLLVKNHNQQFSLKDIDRLSKEAQEAEADGFYEKNNQITF